jgi:hypothetical protein
MVRTNNPTASARIANSLHRGFLIIFAIETLADH